MAYRYDPVALRFYKYQRLFILLPYLVAITQGYRSTQHVVIRIKNTLKIMYDSEVDALYIRECKCCFQRIEYDSAAFYCKSFLSFSGIGVGLRLALRQASFVEPSAIRLLSLSRTTL